MSSTTWLKLMAVGVLIAGLFSLAVACVPAPPVEEDPPAEEVEPPAVELTIWHAYHVGEKEEAALKQVLEQYKADHPNVTVNVLAVPFDAIFSKWVTEVGAGGGPDMFTAPNDNLGDHVRGDLVAPLGDLLAGKLEGFSEMAINGVTVDGEIYAVPGIIKAVGLFYNKAMVATPPATLDELKAQVEGGTKYVFMQHPYHNFGFFTGAFGGTLMDETGRCVADQGGFAEAMEYLYELKQAGLIFETDEGKANTMFMEGEVAGIISGPWMLGTFKAALGDNLGVALMPAGPAGPATPLTGVDGWYINPNSQKKEAAVELALYIFGPEGSKIYTDVAGSPMGRTDVEIADPLVQAFMDIANAGFPRPQSVEFANWWGPFSDAFTKVMEGVAPAADAVAQACADMNAASGF
ncbi:sugar ABC transporter substrate-binding protein [Candidatus Hakubella thermalkaliphila]|uniref:Arabinogalactan oligomer / maltooligosaccharide transport system substrate-binding protein n=3 Tax=Candidatus Hakubella thermalkaliphila TaxID=2754717 RepID=A0A6V8PDA0_9ACTN|nr:extracellular solute-binding protein [Candidatus Hakubella thermalkaliphila]GFP30247.1 arabinogalactan oligomer / maltooligosaccharide transport system substrate-binding protein [Candidatus Hakubella thermalkaliphila]